MTNWVSLAISSTAISGVVSIIDSHLITRRMPGLRTYLLVIGAFHLVYSFVFSSLFPLPVGTGALPIMVAVASGILRTGAIIIMFYTLKKEEVSQVIPIVHAYPVIVVIMAVPLLGETLSYLDYLAIVMVVGGAIAVSFRQSSSGSIIWRGKPLLLLFGASLLLAIADTTSKYAMNYILPWNMFWISGFCMCAIFIPIALRPHTLHQLSDMKQKGPTVTCLVLNEVLAPITILLMFMALEAGPVSLVSTVLGGGRPLFVFIFAFILSRILPRFIEWHADGGMLALRLIAIAMIAGGVVIIQLN